MKQQSLGDAFLSGLANAISDIREKVVEEGYFGRVVNDRDAGGAHWPEAQEPQQGVGSVTREVEVGEIER